jgi:gliding motility-associated-like protein
MKKNLFTFLFLICSLLVSGQVSSTGKYLTFIEKTPTDTVIVFMFNRITPDTQITYDGLGTNINWYKYSDLNNSISNLPYLSPDDANGYVLNVDGKLTKIWVIDYANYLPVYNSFEPENNPGNQCETLNLLLNATIPPITYKYLSGITAELSREFKVTYQTLQWKGADWSLPTDTTITVTMPAPVISIPAPLCNSTFSIVGDQYADGLGVTPTPSKSSEYVAIAVKTHLITTVTPRTEKNEDMPPSKAAPITYSGPIDVEFQSHANEPVAQYYKWQIFKGTQLIISRTDKNHRYTFTDAGVYKVLLNVSNSNCSTIDSITVTVSKSDIFAPNVFTPNGDGHNDEFRVAYRSIVSFECWIYNRWGRQVYHWTDPQKGWDGTINGVKATPGAYFYVIKALGSDYDPKSTPDPKTHVRLGEYLLKGDINLLRGKGN